MADTADLPEREGMDYDVVVVGAGPAGLAAAIRLKQIAPDASVVVGGKGLGGRRAHPLRRGDRPHRSRPSHPRMARGPRPAAENRGEGGPLLLARPSGRDAHSGFPDAAVDEQPRQLHRLARQSLPLARRARRRRWASKSIRALRPPKCFTTTRRRARASPPATWASAARASRRTRFTRGMELRGKYTLFAEGARGSSSKQLIAQLRARQGPRAAEIRHRPQGTVAGLRRNISRASCSTRSAGRSTIAPVAARSSINRATASSRSASSCISTTPTRRCRRSTSSSASRRIRRSRDPRRRQAHLLWRARDHRGGWQACPSYFPRRRADRLLGGLRQRAAHQGQPQRDAVGHAARPKRRRRRSRAGRANDELAAYEAGWRDSDRASDLKPVRNVKPLWSKFGTCARRAAGRARHVDEHAAPRSPFGTLKPWKPDHEDVEAAAQVHAHRLSQARWRDHLRQALVGVPLQHQPRGGPAGPSEAEGPVHSRRARTCRSMASRRSSTARPAFTRWLGDEAAKATRAS